MSLATGQGRRVSDEASNAENDIARAVARAGAEHKRVILVVGCSQRDGEFEPIARMSPQVLVGLLNNWRPTGTERRDD